jgi:hypothetical protein
VDGAVAVVDEVFVENIVVAVVSRTGVVVDDVVEDAVAEVVAVDVGVVEIVVVDGGVDNIGVAEVNEDAVGGVGLTQSVAVGTLKPAALCARTRKAYDVPFVKPLIRIAFATGVPTRVHALPVHCSTA